MPKKKLNLEYFKKYQFALDEFAMFSVTDAKGRILYVNDLFCQVSGFSKKELVQREHKKLKSGLMSQKFYKEMWKTILSGKVWKGEICNRKKDGNLFWVESVIMPVIKRKKVIEFVSIHREITQKKNEEQELLKSKEEALEASKIKSQFLANMSHEIRTPMNGIIGMSNLLLSHVTDREVVEKLNVIQNCSHTLLDLVNDVLDFSKLEVDKIELQYEKFMIHENVQSILEIVKAKSDKKWLNVQYDKDPNIPDNIQGDLTRVRQVLLNLISNAFKFTDKGEIRIRSKLVSVVNDVIEVQFSVQDSGIGIPDNLKDKLFKSFSQVDGSMTRKYGGTGLGLSISKGLCEKMEGRIWVDSQVGQGSTFSFTFKGKLYSDSEKESFKLNSRTELWTLEFARKNPLRILIAEDNRVNQVVVSGLLEKFGYTADVTANGLEVLESLNQQNYDLILMDCHMPEMDGYEATRHILTKYPSEVRPKIYAVTASSTHEDRERCHSVGMDGFISKPITLENLEQALREVIQSKGQRVIFHLENFYKQMDHDRNLAEQIIDTYFRTYESVLKDLEQALTQQNLESFEKSAHSLKGIFANLCAEAPRKTAEAMEYLGKQGTFQNANHMLRQLKKEIFLLNQELRNLRDFNKLGQAS